MRDAGVASLDEASSVHGATWRAEEKGPRAREWCCQAALTGSALGPCWGEGGLPCHSATKRGHPVFFF